MNIGEAMTSMTDRAPDQPAYADQEIADLAYDLWEARGCPEGSPDDDWYRAIELLRSRDQRERAAAVAA